MAKNQVILIECGKCENDIGYINFWNDYEGIVKTLSWRCLVCFELEKLSTKQSKEDNKRAKLPNFPNNWEELKKIKERKLEHINNTIEELNEQRETIKSSKI